MKLTLTRRELRADGIFSELTNSDGKILAHTLEHAYQINAPTTIYTPKLYNGTFKCVKGLHQLHQGPKFLTFEVTGVKSHSGILLHVGNWNKDSDGCILVGSGLAQSSQGKMITGSKQTFKEIMDLLVQEETFTLVVRS